MTDESVTGPFGPYERDSDTRESPLEAEVRRIHDQAAGPAAAGRSMGEHVRAVTMRHLTETCEQAGVMLGLYDRDVLKWLSSVAGPCAAQSVIGIISRAHAAGLEEARWVPAAPPWQALDPAAAALVEDRSNGYE